MTTALFTALLAAQYLLNPLGAAYDPCELLTTAELTAELGGAAAPGVATEDSFDEEVRARVTVCHFEIGNAALSVAVFEFETAEAASDLFTLFADHVPTHADEPRMLRQSGLGEQSLWGASTAAAALRVLKGTAIVSLTFVDLADVDGERLQEPMKRLAESVLTRM
jgi:hypothetical protein